MTQEAPAAGPDRPLPAETTPAGVSGPANPAQDDSGPNEAQVAEMLRWLGNPRDTRTVGELRAVLRELGDGDTSRLVANPCTCDCRCEEPAEAGELCLGCKSFEAS